jgi:16S rRNA C1402 N4-methylase RsmH
MHRLYTRGMSPSDMQLRLEARSGIESSKVIILDIGVTSYSLDVEKAGLSQMVMSPHIFIPFSKIPRTLESEIP